MKRILLLTFIAATVTLLGGCATTDYGTEDTAPHEDNRSRILDSDPLPGPNNGSGPSSY
jgi:hypothetical protein